MKTHDGLHKPTKASATARARREWGAQERAGEATGLETQMRLESRYIFCYLNGGATGLETQMRLESRYVFPSLVTLIVVVLVIFIIYIYM
jgi:hypothetical protein